MLSDSEDGALFVWRNTLRPFMNSLTSRNLRERFEEARRHDTTEVTATNGDEEYQKEPRQSKELEEKCPSLLRVRPVWLIGQR